MDSIIDEQIDPLLLKKFQAHYNDQLREGQPSVSTQFEYAICLIKSKPADTKLGISLLEDLLVRDDDGMAKRDYLYYLSLGFVRIKEYEKAIKYAEALLRVEKENNQALSLRDEAKRRLKRDGMLGAAMLGGAFALGGAVLAGIIAAAASSRRN